MTKDQYRERLPILQAWLDGKPIQCQSGIGQWVDSTEREPAIFSDSLEWRIKPETPKPREWWVMECPHEDRDVAYLTPPVKLESAVHVKEVDL